MVTIRGTTNGEHSLRAQVRGGDKVRPAVPGDLENPRSLLSFYFKTGQAAHLPLSDMPAYLVKFIHIHCSVVLMIRNSQEERPHKLNTTLSQNRSVFIPNITFLLKECRHKMTPKGIMLSS